MKRFFPCIRFIMADHTCLLDYMFDLAIQDWLTWLDDGYDNIKLSQAAIDIGIVRDGWTRPLYYANATNGDINAYLSGIQQVKDYFARFPDRLFSGTDGTNISKTTTSHNKLYAGYGGIKVPFRSTSDCALDDDFSGTIRIICTDEVEDLSIRLALDTLKIVKKALGRAYPRHTFEYDTTHLHQSPRLSPIMMQLGIC